MRKLTISILAGAALMVSGMAWASSDAPQPPAKKWSWDGVFGTYDTAQLRRGFQVYKEVCGNCHSLKLVAYRNLAALGFTEDDIKKIAAEYKVMDGPNDDGAMFERPAKASDRFVPPFPNDKAARAANNGALPPDFSLITKARNNGPNYIHALMMGYADAPAGVTLMDGMNYNKYFPGNQIAMPPQIQDGLVTYADGTNPTADQIVTDTVAFLNWAAEPEMAERKNLGFKVMLFLLVLTGMLFALKKQIWAKVH